MDSKMVYIDASDYDAAMHVFFKKNKISHKKYKQKHIDLFDSKNGLKWIDRPIEEISENDYIFEILNEELYILAKMKYGF
jgi:hypothetical protein